MRALWDSLTGAGLRVDQFIRGAGGSVALAELLRGSSLGGRGDELRGRSVLLATKDQLTAALALIELDGVARRLVLCPPDLPAEQLSSVAARAAVDAVVTGRADPDPVVPGAGCVVICSPRIGLDATPRGEGCQTEWILLTSGTTGLPKLVVHSLASLTAPIKSGIALGRPVVWSTFYDIRRYGGLQIFLRAIIGHATLVLSSAGESTGDFLTRAGAAGVTHISGTPSHWRRVLMSPAAHNMAPGYVRMSGEIADQPIIDHLRAAYPDADVAHAFASTEAGVAFEVGDGLAGFPAGLIGRPGGEVEMNIEAGSLRIRSTRTASGYLGSPDRSLADKDGFVDTGDMIEQRNGRYYFVGRADGVINVGGRKVHPEQVEAVINSHPMVEMSLVRARRNPITGAVVVADVVARHALQATAEDETLKKEIIKFCHAGLAAHMVPAAIRFVPSLAVTGSGKLARFHA